MEGFSPHTAQSSLRFLSLIVRNIVDDAPEKMRSDGGSRAKIDISVKRGKVQKIISQ